MKVFYKDNKTKKYLKTTLFLIIIISLTVLSAISVSSAENYIVLYGFAFDINTDGEAVIHGYDDRSADVVIPKKLMGADVTLIDDYAFFGDGAITSLSLNNAEKLKKIGSNAFFGCNGLKSIEIPSNIEQLSFGAFQNCTALEDLVIQNGIAEIPAQCFYGCYELENVTIPESVTSIGDRAFMNCSKLGTVEIPDSVENIAENAFDGCDNLVIYCKKESHARYYAEENEIPFVVTDGIMFTLGETNGDGIISISDVTAAQQHLADIITLEGACLNAADTNQDGTLDVTDAENLQKYIAGYDVSYPIGELIII